MEDTPLYHRIAETLRQNIMSGELKPGDRLPSVREMAEQWDCTIGTAQRAYRELVRQGLVTSRPGQGTRVVERPRLQGETTLRRMALIHRAEAFLLEVVTAGYSLDDVERAVHQAMDRWRSVEVEVEPPPEKILRFSGSHDLVLPWLAGQFPDITGGYSLQASFTGSLGGLIALAEGKADLAGSHLLDEESGEYNVPYVRRVLPGKRTALVTLAHRRFGLIVPEGNPRRIRGLEDLTQPGLRFINRQPGSGTRVWLDSALRHKGISAVEIDGYYNEKVTHSAVAQAVANGEADAGIGLEAAAASLGLECIPLARDRYDLVIPEAAAEQPPVQRLIEWLQDPETQVRIEKLGGYDVDETGNVTWVD
ncbi:MAG: GntR family transcriptional regulator [Chloroflexi bacterium]|nr:GntR family transcriptional regulator [Chloroflexota bacterium]